VLIATELVLGLRNEGVWDGQGM